MDNQDYNDLVLRSSSTSLQTPTSTDVQLALPVAAVVCLVLVAYITLVVIGLIIRSALVSRGLCGCPSYLCGKEGDPCCNFAECCNCSATSPTVEACLNSICPARKRMTCTDVLLCECCAGQRCCKFCDCCDCQCQGTGQDINCLCFTIKTHEQLQETDESALRST